MIIQLCASVCVCVCVCIPSPCGLAGYVILAEYTYMYLHEMSGVVHHAPTTVHIIVLLLPIPSNLP